jgi:hypothetical protein
MWQVHLLRLSYLLIAAVMGSFVWYQLFFESADWNMDRGRGKALLAGLALLSLWGLRYPIQMLPLMLFELAWKTIWILLIALPSWLEGRLTPDIETMFYECIGVLFVYVVIPWPYVWNRYIIQPSEPWFRRN